MKKILKNIFGILLFILLVASAIYAQSVLLPASPTGITVTP